MQGLKPRIAVEYLGEYTETHNIAYGIVADIFFARVSLLVTRVSLLEFNCVFLKYMFHCPYYRIEPTTVPTVLRFPLHTVLPTTYYLLPATT